MSFSSNTFGNCADFLANGFLIPTRMLIWNLGMILRIVTKVKMNVLLAGPPPVVVRLTMSSLGHWWDIGGTLVKPSSVSSDMYLSGEPVTAP